MAEEPTNQIASERPHHQSPERSSGSATDNLDGFIRRVSGTSIDEIDGAIRELESVREILRVEGERVRREIAGFPV